MVLSPYRRLCEVSSGQFCIDHLLLSLGWITSFVKLVPVCLMVVGGDSCKWDHCFGVSFE